MMLRLCHLIMLPNVRTIRCPFTAPSVPASIFSATHGVRYPFARNFNPVNVKSGALDQLIWHWLHVSPVCRTNAGTRASATRATITSAANATATLIDRMLPPYYRGNSGSNRIHHHTTSSCHQTKPFPSLSEIKLLLRIQLFSLSQVIDQRLDVLVTQPRVGHLVAPEVRHHLDGQRISQNHLFRVLEPSPQPRRAPAVCDTEEIGPRAPPMADAVATVTAPGEE